MDLNLVQYKTTSFKSALAEMPFATIPPPPQFYELLRICQVAWRLSEGTAVFKSCHKV